jgi:hypothetical protein
VIMVQEESGASGSGLQASGPWVRPWFVSIFSVEVPGSEVKDDDRNR